MAQTTRDEESTEIVADDGDFISTGYSCSEYSQDRKDQQSLYVEEVKDENGAEDLYDPDATYIDVSKLPSRNGTVDRQIKVPSQDVSCSQEVTQQVVQTQEIDVCCSQEPTQPVNRSQEIKSSSRNEDLPMTQLAQDSTSCSQESTQPVSPEIINTPPCMSSEQTQDSFSEVSTQPVIASQEIEGSPPDKNDVTLELTPSQDIVDPSQDNKSDMGLKGAIDSLGRKESNESDKVHSLNYQSSLSSGSRVGSSSSSSKRPTDSDDTDDLANASQDMFESQNNSQPPPVTVSQFLPTLQLSGDIPSSQGYEGFRPNLLCPSSPTAGSTSTPLRPVEKRKHDDLRGEVISLSDEEDVLKLSEKRKLSDSSDENKPEVKKAKTNAVDTRQSIVILGEVNPSRKPSTPDSEDPSASSQAFHLHLSQTVDELDLTQSQDSELMDTSTKKALLHKLSSPSRSMDADTSIVQLEDDVEEVQCVSSQKVKPVSAEIVLDSSGQQLLSKSGDIEVLSPSIEHTRCSNQDFKSIHNKVESLPFEKCPNILSPPINKSFIAASSPGEAVVHDLDNSKENIRPGKQVVNVQEFEGDFILTFTCVYKVSCKSVVDMSRKEPVTNSITSFDVLESKTVQRRDSSPSAVEESGGGSPGSIASGPGPFKLQPSHATRFSMMSTTSSSSTNSSVSTYRQAPAVRGRAAVPMWNRKPHGLVPWKELLSGCQNELAESGSEIIEAWAAGNINNTSSDDSKTIIEEKTLGLSVLPEVEDDGEDVMSIPLAAMRRAVLARTERTNSSASNSATSAQNEQSKEELVIKSECETPSKRKRGRPPKTATPSKTPRSSAKKKAPTPRNPKNTETLLAGDQSSIPEDSSLSSGSSYFAPGSSVFAEWDGFYYPGKIENSMQQNQWNVTFHDGFKKVLSRNEIVLINTFEIGQQLLVEVSTDKYLGGEVIDVTPLDSGEDLFTIKFHKSGDKIIVPISKLCLSKQQVQEYLQERPVSAASTSSSSPTKRASSLKFGGSDREILKNLDKLHDLPGKRIRTPKGSQANVNSPSKPGPSSTARQLIPDGNGSSTADDEPLATTLALGANIIVKGVHPEKVGFETADPLARKGKGVKNRGSKKRLQEIEDESVVKQLGPIPPEGSRIFAGYSFFITQTDVQPKHRPDPTTDSEAFTTDVDEQLDSNDMDQCPSDSESFKFTFLPMVKDRIAHQIIQGGGKVLKDWTDIVPKDIKKTYVVSNRPCLTPIFLHCLVRGVRGVNHDYIIYCCRQACNFDSCLKSNLLPIGYSHVIKDFIPWGDQKCISSFLIGENILVVGNKNFKNFWDDFLNQTGAKVSSVKSSRGMSTVTKVLSDNPCPESYVKRAQEMGIPIVSPAWVTQSLINNSRLSVERHPSFKYDYVELD